MTWAAILGKITGTVDQHREDRMEYLETENRILRRFAPGRLRLTDPERCQLAIIAKRLGRSALNEMNTLVKPDTLLEWHRRLVERKIARQRRSQLGRPSTEAELVELVLFLADENPRWGYDRIVGVLAELDYVIAPATVANILRNHGRLTAPQRKKTARWSDFIAAHKEVTVACDFFTKEAWTPAGLVIYYVLFFINLSSRKVTIAGVTPNPNELWMQQVAHTITTPGTGCLHGMEHLILDRDSKFTELFRQTIQDAGVEVHRLPARSPNLNAFAERFVRSIKEECLDHLILFGKGSLQRALDQYLQHYHYERPHQGKGNVILFPEQSPDTGKSRADPIACRLMRLA